VKSVCQSWFGAVVLSLNSSAAFITMKAGLVIRDPDLLLGRIVLARRQCNFDAAASLECLGSCKIKARTSASVASRGPSSSTIVQVNLADHPQAVFIGVAGLVLVPGGCFAFK
jgi:hypothetical protein